MLLVWFTDKSMARGAFEPVAVRSTGETHRDRSLRTATGIQRADLSEWLITKKLKALTLKKLTDRSSQEGSWSLLCPWGQQRNLLAPQNLSFGSAK
jgi:hypothetical protein